MLCPFMECKHCAERETVGYKHPLCVFIKIYIEGVIMIKPSPNNEKQSYITSAMVFEK